MPILVSCPCGKQLRAKDEWAGKRIKCPGCGSAVEVVATLEAASEPHQGISPTRPETRPPKEEDRREQAETPSFWIVPNMLGAKVIALSDEALFVADLDKETLKTARKAFARGEPAEDVLDKEKTVIRFDQVDKIQSNLHGRLVEVFWEPDEGGEKKEENLFCADKEARDELMEALEDRLGWKRQVVEVSRWRASLAPLSVIGIFGFITFCFVMVWAKTIVLVLKQPVICPGCQKPMDLDSVPAHFFFLSPTGLRSPNGVRLNGKSAARKRQTGLREGLVYRSGFSQKL